MTILLLFMVLHVPLIKVWVSWMKAKFVLIHSLTQQISWEEIHWELSVDNGKITQTVLDTFLLDEDYPV